MRRRDLMIAIILVCAWCLPARAQFIDQDKAKIAEHLGQSWLFDLPVNGVAKTDAIAICVQDGTLFARDRLIDKKALIDRVQITMLPDRHVALVYLQTESLEDFVRSLPYLSECKGLPNGVFAKTLLPVSTVNGQAKLSDIWALLKQP